MHCMHGPVQQNAAYIASMLCAVHFIRGPRLISTLSMLQAITAPAIAPLEKGFLLQLLVQGNLNEVSCRALAWNRQTCHQDSSFIDSDEAVHHSHALLWHSTAPPESAHVS
jgi:hypothetical protein